VLIAVEDVAADVVPLHLVKPMLQWFEARAVADYPQSASPCFGDTESRK
jgi:hypothetical protein